MFDYGFGLELIFHHYFYGFDSSFVEIHYFFVIGFLSVCINIILTRNPSLAAKIL
jgi:hypothetical protein